MTAGSIGEGESRRARALRAGAWALLLCALLISATGGLDRLNADAIVYLRLAHLYASGQGELALTPYWGPLFPWLIAPLLRAGVDPLLAGRLILAASALFFLAASLRVMSAMGMRARVPAAILTGLFVIARTGEGITPDLLLAGFLALAVAEMMRPDWGFRAGLWICLAGLAKPVGLPLALLTAGCFGWALWVSGETGWPGALRRVVVTGLVAGLLISPWALVVVAHEGWEGIARTARVNHALMAPGAKAPEHPGTAGFRKPKAGRLTVWESPTGEGYTYWSPWASWRNFVHQLEVLQRNIRRVLNYLLDFDLLLLGPIAALAGLLLHRPWRENMRRHRWRWAGIPFLCVCAVYLPVFSSSRRYYYPAYPFLLIAVFGMALWIAGEEHRWRRRIATTIIFFCMALPLAGPVGESLGGPRDGAVVAARRMAERLRAAELSGSLAGDHPERAYLAFFLRAPWFGWQDSDPSPESFRGSDAELIAVRRGSQAEARLREDRGFEDLDGRLFAGADEAGPVHVFRRLEEPTADR